MKKLILPLLFVVIFSNAWAQVPHGISYQAVIRDSENELVTESVVSVRISLIQGTDDGTVVYEEAHDVLSNLNGLVTFVIGRGVPTQGSFEQIDWKTGPYFIKMETDPGGGNNYLVTGTSQLFSVPYALYAENAAGMPPVGTSPGEMLYWDGSKWISIAPGLHGQTLSFCNGMPSWEKCKPIVTTSPITGTYGTIASGGGEVVDDGGLYVYQRGVCYSTSPGPTTGDDIITAGAGTGSFTCSFSGLTPAFTYYVRAFAVNEGGTSYGEEVSFIAGAAVCGVDVITDIDGNAYNTILLYNKCWMKDNLKTTRYRNGSAIVYPGANFLMWQNNTTGAYAWYNNNINWKESYGALYNWYATNNAGGLCPAGWRLPSNAEWAEMISHIDGYTSTAGNKLKSCRQENSPLGGECNTSDHPRWDSHEVNYGTDEYDFSAFPGGSRLTNGNYQSIGQNGEWWNATELNEDFARYHRILYLQSEAYGGQTSKNKGMSVRCIME